MAIPNNVICNQTSIIPYKIWYAAWDIPTQKADIFQGPGGFELIQCMNLARDYPLNTFVAKDKPPCVGNTSTIFPHTKVHSTFNSHSKTGTLPAAFLIKIVGPTPTYAELTNCPVDRIKAGLSIQCEKIAKRCFSSRPSTRHPISHGKTGTLPKAFSIKDAGPTMACTDFSNRGYDEMKIGLSTERKRSPKNAFQVGLELDVDFLAKTGTLPKVPSIKD
ncbi:hypothetical protein K449DRAFT_428426 [Hypoxylon sp. EC38]|nr:hypothetical protein K449DRAFT_428426 [Hypoxylon sp. EC38]